MCDSFKDKGAKESNSIASRLKVCKNCLSCKHFLRDYPRTRSCRDCGRQHHSLLYQSKQCAHTAKKSSDSPASSDNSHTPVSDNPHVYASDNTYVPASDNSYTVPPCNSAQGKPRVIIGTFQVTVESRGRIQSARTLLDSGSHFTFVTSPLTQALKVKKIMETAAVTGISQAEVPNSRYKINLVLVAEGKQKVPASGCD